MKLSLPRNIKLKKTWIVLGAAISIGLLAALAARTFLTKQIAEIEARGKGKTVAVVVAKKDLPKGAVLSSANVAVRPIPQDFAHSVAILPDQFDRVDGQTLAYPVKSGEMLLWGLMETKRAPSFSARVDAGHRAITVPVDEINSISGMLEPGDAIDLLVTVNHQSKKTTFVLQQSVPVLATGQRSIDDPKTGERRSFSTVTLDTTPEQAQEIIIARDLGKLTALLRNPDDKKVLNAPKVDLALLMGLKEKNGQLVSGQIPVLYGGGSAKLPPEGLTLGQYVSTPVNPFPGRAQAPDKTAGSLPNEAEPLPTPRANIPVLKNNDARM